MSPSDVTPLGSTERTETTGTSAIATAFGRILQTFKLTPGTRARLSLGRPARVVLWGGRRRDLQAGSDADRDRARTLDVVIAVYRGRMSVNDGRRLLHLPPLPATTRVRLPR